MNPIKENINNFLELLLNVTEVIDYNKGNTGEESFAFYPKGWGAYIELKCLSHGITIKVVNIDLLPIKDPNIKESVFFVKDYREIKPALDKMISLYEKISNLNINYMPVEDFNEISPKYIEIFKKVLRQEELPKGFMLEKVWNENVEEIIVLEGEKKHTIFFEKNNEESENNINTLLGIVAVKANIDLGNKIIKKKELKMNANIYLIISGYEIERYPYLEMMNKKINTATSYQEWINQLLNHSTKNFTTNLRHTLLSEELLTNEKSKAKKKI